MALKDYSEKNQTRIYYWTFLKERIFMRLFEIAEISKLNKEEYKQYEQSLNAYRDIKNSIETAEEKGIVKGRKEGEKDKAHTIAKIMLEDEEPMSKIIKYTGLSEEEIRRLNH